MRFTSIAASLLFAATASGRFLIYADEWHPTRPTDPADRAGIDHVVLAFAQANNTAAFQPKVPISTFRSEYPNAKIMIAIGGWGDTAGFTEATKTDAGIAKFANDVKTLVTNTGVDGIDIDWEYPGGNGADYKEIPNSAKVHEIDGFPKLLSAVRTAIGKDKLLSIAVPGKKVDMVAFTAKNGPLIWPSVDYINGSQPIVMSYDLMNRRDTVTAHHTSVKGATEAIKNYLAIEAPASKINLGFANYAKYFTVAGSCTTGLACPIVTAEDPATGKDTLTSGAWTFETTHMAPVNASALSVSTDGTCGPEKGTKCATGCCSQYGNCGVSREHCSGACQHAFGTGCTDPDIAGSWQLAAETGIADKEEGGQYYYDAVNGIFWTWDTPYFIERKFKNIVKEHGLGGVMAWSLGEDSADWSHIRQIAKNVQSGRYTAAAGASAVASPVATLDVSPVASAPSSPAASPSTSKKYDVVYVDGPGGPDAEPSTLATSVSAGVKAAGVKAAAASATGYPPVVPVSGTGTKSGGDEQPGPDDDWEWVWYNEDGTLWKGEGR
ncbi:glycoside hydrolase [Byssothecium circinans]|uniref:chitinase n=1 Tax=Byssothecium circinans TaxID=147558 RepID=A0A6A5TI53_9PLEO|nr:glycoside hydrolase [Byssothecium circinans]